MKSVIICTLPRTGSSLLAAGMRSTGALGAPNEFFNPPKYERLAREWGVAPDDLGAYIEQLRIRTATPNGVVGVKLMVRHLDHLTKQGMLPSGPDRLNIFTEQFGDVVVVKLVRNDKLRQAISLTRAKQTGKWGSPKEERAEPFFDRIALTENLVRIVKAEAKWERELQTSGISPALTVHYEDLASATDEVLLQLAELVGLPEAAQIVDDRQRGAVKLQRQADALTEEWYDRFIGG